MRGHGGDIEVAEAFIDRMRDALYGFMALTNMVQPHRQELLQIVKDAHLQGWHEAMAARDGDEAHDLVCRGCGDTFKGDEDYRAGKSCPNRCGGSLEAL